MSPELQSVKAQARHAKAKTEGKTCIECHFAIAHKEPEGPGPTELFKKPETK
jgi:cytochrome c-type protein NapC